MRKLSVLAMTIDSLISVGGMTEKGLSGNTMQSYRKWLHKGNGSTRAFELPAA